jgi:hypothetical protein
MLLAALVSVALIFDFLNGLHDAANSIGVVCAGLRTDGDRWPSGPNPRLVHNLPGWLLKELRGDAQGPVTDLTDELNND